MLNTMTCITVQKINKTSIQWIPGRQVYLSKKKKCIIND